MLEMIFIWMKKEMEKLGKGVTLWSSFEIIEEFISKNVFIRIFIFIILYFICILCMYICMYVETIEKLRKLLFKSCKPYICSSIFQLLFI